VGNGGDRQSSVIEKGSPKIGERPLLHRKKLHSGGIQSHRKAARNGRLHQPFLERAKRKGRTELPGSNGRWLGVSENREQAETRSGKGVREVGWDKNALIKKRWYCKKDDT